MCINQLTYAAGNPQPAVMPTRPTPLPTRYADCMFRSRLEARWAVFLDQIREPWRYEPERYGIGGQATYLPDFHLPRLGSYLEVKGQRDGTEDRARRFSDNLVGNTCYLAVGDMPRTEDLAETGWTTIEALSPAFEWDDWFPPGNAFILAAVAAA